MASFMLAPAPTGPTGSMRRQSPSRIGRARATSAASPPTRPMSLPARAGPVVPPTGHSTNAAPLARTSCASAISVSGCTVLISMTSLPSRFSESSPDRAAINGVERLGVGQDGDDRLDARRELGRRRGRGGARIGQRLRLVRRAVPDGQLVADLHEALRHGGAHAAEPGNSDAHGSAPSLTPSSGDHYHGSDRPQEAHDGVGIESVLPRRKAVHQES